MAQIESVTIRRFKRLQDVTIQLSNSTVIVGSNNSGKSSVLQALHFAVAVAQSCRLVGGVNWAADLYQVSFSPTQLLYTPTADILNLSTGGNLTEDINRRIEIMLSDANGDSCTVALRRGRGRNVAISIEGRALGERLQDLTSPFSVYAPGLAGIPKEEQYISPGPVRRAIARGDANLVLRNVLYQLSRNAEGWAQFHEDIRDIFPNLEIQISFDEETDEHLRATVSLDDGQQIPLDAAGTAVLQASQILSYITLFKPELLILDEPDSHLHPNNQRALCSLIFRLSQTRGFQAVISTHSRHVLDALRGLGNLVWLSQGAVVENAEQDVTRMLLDIGALDSLDYFADGTPKCVVATEDDDRDAVEQVLWSSGFVQDETEVLSYSGVSKVEAAVVLGRFLNQKAPNVRLVVHRDRDYMTPDEVERFSSQLRNHDIEPFVTEHSDIEGYYLRTEHVLSLNPNLDADRIAGLLNQALAETQDKSIASIVNLRTQEAFKRRTRDGVAVDHGSIAVAAQRDYEANPVEWARGKIVLGRLKALVQKELGANQMLVAPSPHLRVPALSRIAGQIWRVDLEA